MSEGALIEIAMACPDLRRAPRFTLPAPYRIRWWRTGDLGVWLAIQREADRLQTVAEPVFRKYYGRNEAEFPQRICFLCDQAGREVGTASAWYGDSDPGKDWGRVHWVAIVPLHQGKGLARPLISAVLDRMEALGHRKAYLTTESERILAIRLYLSLGFKPAARSAAERRAWLGVGEKMEGWKNGIVGDWGRRGPG